MDTHMTCVPLTLNVLYVFVFLCVLVQSTPFISRELGAKIRERKLSGSLVISRFRAKAQTRDLKDHSPTLWRLHLLNPNSMLNDNRCTTMDQNYGMLFLLK